MLSLAAIAPPRRHTSATRHARLAVIIPAHNEEKLIAPCVRSILESSLPPVAVYVIAHNCSDETAANAAAAGAAVLPLSDDGVHGKGAALLYGFGIALQHGADAVMVIDADSQVSPALIEAAAGAFAAGANAIQARYIAADPEDSDRSRLMALGLYGMNVLRPRGRDRLGLSCGIFGNGFALSAETLRSIPYTAHSIVEDLEYHLALVRSGRRVLFLDEVEVYGEVPDNKAAAATQRARWEGGRARMRRELWRPLALEVLSGKLKLLEPLLDLIALPTGKAVMLLALTALVPVPFARFYALAGFTAIVLYVITSAMLSPNPAALFRALLSVPKYLLFKLGLAGKTRKAASKQTEWVRTKRND